MTKQEKAMIRHKVRWKDWSEVEGRLAPLFINGEGSKWR